MIRPAMIRMMGNGCAKLMSLGYGWIRPRSGLSLLFTTGISLNNDSMYVKSMAVAMHFLCIVSIGPLADNREPLVSPASYRKI